MADALDGLIDALRRLPGVGVKSAQRMAFHLLQHDREGAQRLAHALTAACANVRHCERCHTFTEAAVCDICSDPQRDARLLCVVETPADQAALERTGSYRGLYFVLMGLVFALFAVVLTMITGNPIWDAIGTLGIGALLIVVAVFVAVEVKAMLIGQSVEGVQREAIRAFIEQRPEIKRVFNLITLQMGNDILVSVQAEMADSSISVADAIARINATEMALKARFPDVKWCFFEPDDSA